ncbi:MAG: 16S rRNA (guanine(966)-N(2))-methyltransferase RsmD [Verrucomicrobiales bacterium]
MICAEALIARSIRASIVAMRIIAGTAGGIPLLSPSDDTRPTTDRVRSAVFSILTPRVPQARVLDLFAGSGALALEAVSRGARSALCIESGREACSLIRRNATKAKLGDRVAVRQADVFAWLKSAAGRETYDLVFADPPYRKKLVDSDFAAALLDSAALPEVFAEGGLFVLESHAGPAMLAIPPQWRLLDQRTYGASRISFLEVRPPLTGRSE